MSQYVHLQVSFACDENDEVAQAANQYVAESSGDSFEGSQEALMFLRDLAGRSGPNYGVKGGLSLWGMIGNCSDVDRFVKVLTPFWLDLLAGGIPGGPHPFEHIVILYEYEQSGSASAIEVYLEDPWSEGDVRTFQLAMKKHDGLPFAWKQM